MARALGGTPIDLAAPGPAEADPAGSGPGAGLHFADLTLLPARRELLRAGRPVAIGERAFVLLRVLAENAGELVTKEALTRAAWNGRSVEASNLTVQVAGLRRILRGSGTSADPDALIRTVPGRGYLLTAPVTRSGNDRAPLPAPAPSAGRSAPALHPAEPPTLFVGRSDERSALAALLAENRNVCVVGIGGVGKTRLVLRLRRELAPAYPDGILFVDLAPLSDPGQVAEAVAAALDAGSGTAPAEAAILSKLHDARRLLIVDNAEHLLPAVRQLLVLVLGACPGVSVLVTSRESLGIPGEAVFRLLPLAVPSDEEITAADALAYDAVGLFADRARSLIPDFRVHDGNARHVAGICRRLDGIALAIEMAVPRLEVLSLHQLSERLRDRFGALAAPRHPVPSRQRTLRAMFDWSWDLLSVPERALLRLIAVFAGGATLDALEALTPGGVADRPNVVDLLAGLAQKSLVVVSMPRLPEQEPRYGVLETTRQYALDQVDAAEAAHLQRAHALHLAACFERADAEWPTTHSAAWLGRYGPEADNLRAAMRWAFGAEAETEIALRLVAHSSLLWWELPGLPLRESRHWHLLATDRIGPETLPGVQARLWFGLSWTDTIDGDVENYPAARRAVDLFREAGHQVGLGAALWRAASTVMYRDDHRPTAACLLTEAERVLEGQPAFKWQALCRIRRADLLQYGEALDGALAEYDRASSMVEATDHQYGRMVCGGNRSYLLFKLGRRDEAIGTLRSLRRDLAPGLAWPLISQLAMLLMAADQRTDALAVILESLAGTLGTGMLATLGRTLEALALALVQSGDGEAAAIIFGHVLKQHPVERVRLGPRQVVFEHLKAALDVAFPRSERDRLMSRGRLLGPTEIAEMAMQLCREACAGQVFDPGV